jgi:hypothetical protein
LRRIFKERAKKFAESIALLPPAATAVNLRRNGAGDFRRNGATTKC